MTLSSCLNLPIKPTVSKFPPNIQFCDLSYSKSVASVDRMEAGIEATVN